MSHLRFSDSMINRAWLEPGTEPALAELYADPVLHLVLRRDGITLGDLQRVVGRAQCALRSQVCRCAA